MALTVNRTTLSEVGEGARWPFLPPQIEATLIERLFGSAGEPQAVEKKEHEVYPIAPIKIYVWDAENPGLPGRLVVEGRVEGEERIDPSLDPVNNFINGVPVGVEELYANIVTVDQFFRQFFKRNSIDDKGMPIVVTVNCPTILTLWDPVYKQIICGQIVVSNGFGGRIVHCSSDFDLIAHEMMRGMVNSVSKLEYQGQSGPLLESIIDIFTWIAKRFAGEAKRDQEWLIGNRLMRSISACSLSEDDSIHKVALRSLSDPGLSCHWHSNFETKICSKTIREYVDVEEDHERARANSSIPSYACYLACRPVNGLNESRLLEQVGWVWYQVIVNNDNPHLGFADFAWLTTEQATKIEGGFELAKTIRKAWENVGVKVAEVVGNPFTNSLLLKYPHCAY